MMKAVSRVSPCHCVTPHGSDLNPLIVATAEVADSRTYDETQLRPMLTA